MVVKNTYHLFLIKEGGLSMYNRKISLNQNVDSFDFGKTKKNVNNYFEILEGLKWEQAKLNAQKGLTANYKVQVESDKQGFITIGKDAFNLSALETNNEAMAKHLLDFYWAQSILSEQEQLYITEYFVNGKYENEVIGLLGFNASDSRAFRKLKRRAIYKFAYVLNLVV